ncbi:MAG: Baseplate J-like protein [bacterium]|nr:Baseplate J-like protein [bacterium]
MPFARPTLAALIDRAAADIQARLPGSDARLRRSNLDVLARVHAGAVHGLYGHLDFLSRQIIVDTAEADYLDRWASIWGVTRNPAVAATGSVVFTGANGAIIPAGTSLQRSDGAGFTTAADATIVAGTATATASAALPGATGNTDANALLNFSSAVPSVNGQATVGAGGLTQGTDVEEDDSLRARLLSRIQQPPQGGAKADYIAWALQVSGVTRAWPYPGELGAGTVTLRFVRDDDAGSIIPDAGEVAAVQAYIDARRPVTAALTVVAPIADVLNFTIQLTPNTAAVQAAVQAELQDLLRREAQPGGTLLLSHIREAISVAAGETDSIVTVPAATVVSAVGHIPIMGVITWV